MAVLKKLLLLVIILLTCCIALSGCKDNNPEVTTSIVLSPIAEDEYSQIYKQSKPPEGITINDLKKLHVDVKISNSKKVKERTITIPDLFVINKYDRVRAIHGGSYEKNNIETEELAESSAYVIFDNRGLSEEDLRSLYSGLRIYVSYKFKNNNLIEKGIFFGENFTIEN